MYFGWFILGEEGVLLETNDELLADTNIYEILSDDNVNSLSENPEVIEISDTNDKDSKDCQKESEASDNNNDPKDDIKDTQSNKSDQPQQSGTKGPKKRRGSELANLDHWGKSKQRRSSRKKNIENVSRQCDDDETVEEALKRIVPQSLL